MGRYSSPETQSQPSPSSTPSKGTRGLTRSREHTCLCPGPRRQSPRKPCSSSRCPPDLSKNLRGPGRAPDEVVPGAGTIVHALRARMEQAIVHQKSLGRLRQSEAKRSKAKRGRRTRRTRSRTPAPPDGKASARRSCAFCRRSHCLPAGSTSWVITCG